MLNSPISCYVDNLIYKPADLRQFLDLLRTFERTYAAPESAHPE